MGIGLIDPDATHRVTLVAAVLLGMSGLGALNLVGSGVGDHAARLVAPTPARTPAPTYLDLIEGTTTTSRRYRTPSTWAAGSSMEVPRSFNEPATPSDPEGTPPTQVDVAVPAAGAQVSAGEGEDSCTTVQMSAITPEGCPPPSGDGPVVVGYQGDGPDPGNLPRDEPVVLA
jgi:hypothetical protein